MKRKMSQKIMSKQLNPHIKFPTFKSSSYLNNNNKKNLNPTLKPRKRNEKEKERIIKI